MSSSTIIGCLISDVITFFSLPRPCTGISSKSSDFSDTGFAFTHATFILLSFEVERIVKAGISYDRVKLNTEEMKVWARTNPEHFTVGNLSRQFTSSYVWYWYYRFPFVCLIITIFYCVCLLISVYLPCIFVAVKRTADI